MILFLVMMTKTLNTKSSQSGSINAKNLLKENLNRLSKQEDSKAVDHKLKKAFQNLIQSGAIEKLKQFSTAKNDDPAKLFLLTVISDLMEKNQKFREDLIQVTDAYEDMVGLITHEFKNILTSVHGYNMMMERELDAKDEKEVLGILKSSDRLTHQLFDMSDSLLKMSLGEKGLLDPEYKLINFIEDILLPIEKDLNDAAQDKNMKIVTRKPSGDLIIEADDGMLDIVMRNLLINAIRYGEDGTDIIFTIERINKDCVVTVKNKCENIPDNFCNDIFQKFTTKKIGKVKGGTGLGLYNVKKIIDLHQGKVNCRVIDKNFIEFKIALPQNIL
jgi:signal transduction histidine kinase